MTTQTAANPSVTDSDNIDVQLTVIFTPAAAVGSTVVEVEGDPALSLWRYYQLVSEAAERLTVYAQEYRQAAEEEGEGDMSPCLCGDTVTWECSQACVFDVVEGER